MTSQLVSTRPTGETAQIAYELDPAGSVTFAKNGKKKLMRDPSPTVTAGGTTLNDGLDLAGSAPTGTIVAILVVATGKDGIDQVEPCNIEIL